MNQFPPSRFNFFRKFAGIFAVVHLRISPRIFENFFNNPNVIFGGLREDDSWKKTWSKRILWHFPFTVEYLRDVPVSVEVVLVAGLAGGVHRGVPIRAGARVGAGQRGVHFRHLQTGENFEKLSYFNSRKKGGQKTTKLTKKRCWKRRILFYFLFFKKGFYSVSRTATTENCTFLKESICLLAFLFARKNNFKRNLHRLAKKWKTFPFRISYLNCSKMNTL